MEQEIAEVEQLAQQWVQAFNEGNTELISSMYAEDAQFIGNITPFRLEGKEAINDMLAGIVQAFPTRLLNLRQPSTRIYNDTTAAMTHYYELTLADNAGQITNYFGRVSVALVKQGGRWLIVNHHASDLPAST